MGDVNERAGLLPPGPTSHRGDTEAPERRGQREGGGLSPGYLRSGAEVCIERCV